MNTIYKDCWGVKVTVDSLKADAASSFWFEDSLCDFSPLYNVEALRSISLPLRVACSILQPDGLINSESLSRAKKMISVKSDRDGVEQEIACTLKALKNKRVVRCLESMTVPSHGSMAERLIRASLLLDECVEMSVYHVRLVALASLCTWLRQQEGMDCYVKALLLQLKAASSLFLLHDFKSFMDSGGITRSIQGKSFFTLPLESITLRATVSSIPVLSLHQILALSSVKKVCFMCSLSEENIKKAVEQVKSEKLTDRKSVV